MSTSTAKITPELPNASVNVNGAAHVDGAAVQTAKRQKPLNKYYLGSKAKTAMEGVMERSAAGQGYVDELLGVREAAEKRLAALQVKIAGLSKLDHRVPELEKEVLEVRLLIADLGSIAAKIAVAFAENERAARETIAQSRKIPRNPKLPKSGDRQREDGSGQRDGHSDEQNGGASDGSQQQTRGGPP